MASRSWRGHPLWLVGFRPFFLLACLAGASLPLGWMLVLTGRLTPALPPITWHAHEMFYGFGLAVLGGFLLTATKNWVQVRGHHGRLLQVLVAAWLLERVAIWFGGAWPTLPRLLAEHLFGVLLVGSILWTLVRNRKTDSYPDNPLFMVALPALLVARALMLDPLHFAQGRDLTLALFRMAFLVMLERTSVPFMKAAFQVALPRRAWLDGGIKALGLALLAAPWFPMPVRSALDVALAALFLGRTATWSPQIALRRLDVGVMYAGGIALAAQLLLDAAPGPWLGSVSVHLFTFGVMGLIIPAMLVRIGLGHTGRPVKFELRDRVPIWLMSAALVARVVAPQLWPERYTTFLWIAAFGWTACFTLVGLRIAPLVLAERLDGKEH